MSGFIFDGTFPLLVGGTLLKLLHKITQPLCISIRVQPLHDQRLVPLCVLRIPSHGILHLHYCPLKSLGIHSREELLELLLHVPRREPS